MNNCSFLSDGRDETDDKAVYEELRNEYYGFANKYLDRCRNNMKSIDSAELNVYRKLLSLDRKLGTTESEQLYSCVSGPMRLNLIKVRLFS